MEQAANDNRNPSLLTADELCDRWRGQVSVKTLANWRHLGQGPAYVKIGGSPLYPVERVEEWERSRTMNTRRKSG